MKAQTTTRLLALIVTAGVFSACGIKNGEGVENLNPIPVDEYRIDQLSKTVCPTPQKLRLNSEVMKLNLNNLIATGKVKAIAFRKGAEDCALKFSFDFSNNENRLTGNLTLAADGNATPPQPGGNYRYDLVLPNSAPEKCVINGSAWEVVTAGESNQSMVITFRNLSDTTTSQYLNLISDKLVTVKPLAEATGISAYTCQ